MANLTIRDFNNMLSSLPSEILDLEFPIDFQDVSAEDMTMVDTYNEYLANKQFTKAYEYRKDNPKLESYIFDATKMNYLQTLLLTVQSAKGTYYDNGISGAKADNVQDALDECFQYVGDGKELLASAITDKKVPTDASASFSEMAKNIRKIVLGSGNATKSDVLKGKTFTNNDGVQYTGTMVNNAGLTKSATATIDETNKRIQLTAPANAYYSTTSKLYTSYMTLANLIGLTANKIAKGNKILGITGTAVTVDTSTGYVILSSTNVSTGKELTGGWTPSGEFGVGSYGNETAKVSSNNYIDLTNINSVQFNYSFGILASYANAEYITDYPYFQCYLINSAGNKVSTQTIYAKNKTDGGSQIATINTSSLTGKYKIGYVCSSYWREEDRYRDDGSEYEVTYGAATNISRIALY